MGCTVWSVPVVQREDREALGGQTLLVSPPSAHWLDLLLPAAEVKSSSGFLWAGAPAALEGVQDQSGRACAFESHRNCEIAQQSIGDAAFNQGQIHYNHVHAASSTRGHGRIKAIRAWRLLQAFTPRVCFTQKQAGDSCFPSESDGSYIPMKCSFIYIYFMK